MNYSENKQQTVLGRRVRLRRKTLWMRSIEVKYVQDADLDGGCRKAFEQIEKSVTTASFAGWNADDNKVWNCLL